MAVNMDHAQLRFSDPTAALQLSSAMHRYRLPRGLPARLFQNLAACSHTCCNGLRPNSAKKISVEVEFGRQHQGPWAAQSAHPTQ